MLEQKDFVNAESLHKKALKSIKAQYKNGNISNEVARYQAKIELLNLERKLPVLKFILSNDDMNKIKKLIKSFEDFIALTKSSDLSI